MEHNHSSNMKKGVLPGRSVMSPGDEVSDDNEEAAEKKRNAMDKQQPIMHQVNTPSLIRTPLASVSISDSDSGRASSLSLTNLSRRNDVLVFRVLIDGQTEDIIRVLQVEALSSCQDRKQEVFKSLTTAMLGSLPADRLWMTTVAAVWKMMSAPSLR